MEESKVLQYFGNMRYNLATSDAFAEVVTNHARLWDAELTWYWLSAIWQICLYGLEHCLRIYGFRPKWSCLIIKVLAIPSKIFWAINCVFTFQTTNCFGHFYDVMAQFELVMHKFLNFTTLHIHLYGFQILHAMKQYTICWCTNYHDSTNHSWSFSRLELLWSHDMSCKLAHTQILQNFWLALVIFIVSIYVLLLLHLNSL